LRKLFFFLPLFIFGLLSCRQQQPGDNYVEDPDFHRGQALLFKNNDSAFYYFNRVISRSKDSLQVAMSYNNMAVIQADAGDYFGSQESLLTSIRFLNAAKENNLYCLSSNYNELGLNSFNLKSYGPAIAFYDSAYQVARDKNLKLVIANNKALAYQKKGAYGESLKLYRQTIAQTPKNGKEYARILSNMAKTKFLDQPGYNAAPELLTALRIRRKENDLWGQNASFAHLADYYAGSKPDSAFFYAGEMYAVARRLQSPDDQLEALQKLIRFGPANRLKMYFQAYQRLDDSVQTARAAARNQFALIRYDAEKNKADNLKLQKDNTEKKYQIIRQKVLLYVTVFVLLAGTLIAGFWYNRRKKRLELEKQVAVRAGQLKLSKKVHDEVANGLYRVISEVENGPEMDKELLLDKMDLLYRRSRDISYDDPRVESMPFHREIEELILSFATEKAKVLLVGNGEAFWTGVDAGTRRELRQVLQELMVNMRKHSHAREVVLKFETLEGGRGIDYRDDGKGFQDGVSFGNGLTNTGNRINDIGGKIIFDGNTGKGLTIQLSFPIV